MCKRNSWQPSQPGAPGAGLPQQSQQGRGSFSKVPGAFGPLLSSGSRPDMLSNPVCDGVIKDRAPGRPPPARGIVRWQPARNPRQGPSPPAEALHGALTARLPGSRGARAWAGLGWEKHPPCVGSVSEHLSVAPVRERTGVPPAHSWLRVRGQRRGEWKEDPGGGGASRLCFLRGKAPLRVGPGGRGESGWAPLRPECAPETRIQGVAPPF